MWWKESTLPVPGSQHPENSYEGCFFAASKNRNQHAACLLTPSSSPLLGQAPHVLIHVSILVLFSPRKVFCKFHHQGFPLNHWLTLFWSAQIVDLMHKWHPMTSNFSEQVYNLHVPNRSDDGVPCGAIHCTTYDLVYSQPHCTVVTTYGSFHPHWWARFFEQGCVNKASKHTSVKYTWTVYLKVINI